MLEKKLGYALECLSKKQAQMNRQIDTDQLKRNMQALQTAITKIRGQIAIREVAVQCGLISGALLPEIRDNLSSALIGCKKDLDDNGDLRNQSIQSVNQAASEYQRHIAGEWQQSSERNRAVKVRSSLNVFSSFLSNPEEARRMVVVLNQEIDALPTTPHLIRQLSTHIQSGEAMLSGAGLDEEIKLFIQKIRNSSATLDDLSPGVLTWLKKHSMTAKIKLSLT